MDPKDPWYIFFPNMLRRIGHIWNVKSYLRKHKSDPEPSPEPVVDARHTNRVVTRWNGDGMLDWKLVEYLDTLPDSEVPAAIETWNRQHCGNGIDGWNKQRGVGWGKPVDNKDEVFDSVSADLKLTWDRLKEVIDKRDAEIAKLGQAEPGTEKEYTALHARFDALEGMLERPATKPVPPGVAESDIGGVRSMILPGISSHVPPAASLMAITSVTSNEKKVE
jgi:hypothetical protein